MANMIRSTTIHRSLEKDQLVWTKTSSGDFSVRSAYKELICRDNPVYWHGIVWSKMVIPRHAFTMWQLFSNCLPTQDSATVYFLWTERNARRFRNISSTKEALAANCLKEIREYLQVHIINGKEVVPWECFEIVAEIKAKMAQMEDSRIEHIFRECNAAADFLATLDDNLFSSCSFFTPPLDIRLQTLVNDDVNGKLYMRL
ncbi:hypothetical protein FRX31_012098 [Thalictrum thalictroides]|uniref:Reverse transcriptase zinc-binding domain-containing protein n=1 Tax=Thalictrum thalictroides TaxID=46969 RepID=A0A7J6WPD8_THATH|nr:hypothetical protein FRX31_012098 [Thalictrum thalictroides]